MNFRVTPAAAGEILAAAERSGAQGMARQMQQMQTRLAKIQEELGSETVEASELNRPAPVVIVSRSTIRRVVGLRRAS